MTRDPARYVDGQNTRWDLVLRVTPDKHAASHVVNRTGTEILLSGATAS
jgi:hypothetical protein